MLYLMLLNGAQFIIFVIQGIHETIYFYKNKHTTVSAYTDTYLHDGA